MYANSYLKEETPSSRSVDAALKMNLPSKVTAEFFGTFALVFFGCGSLSLASIERFSISPSIVPLIFGAIIAAMVYAFGHISGAHFNPAVTLGFVVGKHFPIREVLPYWTGQIAGASVAALTLKYLIPESSNLGVTIPEVSVPAAIAWEFVLTFFLMFVIISVATDTRAVGTMAGAAIGLMVALGAFLGGPFTGASMNPARTIGPAVIAWEWNFIFVYLIGPFFGATAAALLYERMRCHNEKPTSSAKGCC